MHRKAAFLVQFPTLRVVGRPDLIQHRYDAEFHQMLDHWGVAQQPLQHLQNRVNGGVLLLALPGLQQLLEKREHFDCELIVC